MKIYFDLTSLIGGLAVFAAGLLLYSRRKRGLVNKYWFALCCCAAVWSFLFYFIVNSTSLTLSLFLRFFLDTAVILIILFWVFFVSSFLKKKSVLVNRLVATATLLMIILNFSPWMIRGMSRKYIFNYYVDAGFGYYVLVIYFLSIVIYGLRLMLLEYHKSFGIRAQQIRTMIFGSAIGFLGGGSAFLLSFNVPFPPYLFILLTIFPLIIAYGVIRYRLMDVRAVIFRSIGFGLIFFIITTFFILASSGILEKLPIFAGVYSRIFSGALIAVAITFGYKPLRSAIERVTNSYLYKLTYDPDKLLASVTEVTSSILDLSQLLKSLSKVMGDAFHYEKFGITLLDEKNKMEIFYKEGFKPAVAEGLVSYKGVTEALYKELEQVSGLLVIDEMKTRFENGEFKPADPVLLNLLHENDIAVIVPLYVKDRLIGIFAVGNKKSGDSYSTQDLGILRIIAGQAGIAIENARLYEELKTFNIKLEQEVRRKTMQLRHANTDLKQLDKAKSEFISIASHQLRTPLTVIKGYISMMQEGSFGAVPTPIAENLKKVFISNERLIQLVEDLLDISRIESGRQEFNWAKIRLENLAQTVVDNLMQSAGAKDLKLAFHKPAKPTPEVVADENKLHEVMMNFVDNAIKYTPSGQIDVFVRVDKGDVVTFCVKDTGKGITPELQDVLFKKFSRGKDSFRSHTEGLGLGLYVAKLMMEAHKGKIWAESDGEGKGSSFCFSIPVKGVELKAGEKSEGNLIKPTTAKTAVVPATSK